MIVTIGQIHRWMRKSFRELMEIHPKEQVLLPRVAKERFLRDGPARLKARLALAATVFLEGRAPSLPPAPIRLSFPQAEAERQRPAANPDGTSETGTICLGFHGV